MIDAKASQELYFRSVPRSSCAHEQVSIGEPATALVDEVIVDSRKSRNTVFDPSSAKRIECITGVCNSAIYLIDHHSGKLQTIVHGRRTARNCLATESAKLRASQRWILVDQCPFRYSISAKLIRLGIGLLIVSRATI